MYENNENFNQPRFSVIISVYNSGRTLSHAIDNLIYQTFKNLEVIIVDKESTDNSKEIEEQYAYKYPDIIRVFNRPYTDNPAAGRNYGIKVARANYIAFCDADDYYDIRAFERLDTFLNSHNNSYDLVCYGVNFICGSSIQSTNYFSETSTKESLLLGDYPMGFWNKLFKKELLDKCGEILDSMLDDLSYIPFTIAYARRVGFFRPALYYHNLLDGISKNSNSVQNLDIMRSIDHVFENIPSKYLGQFSVCAAARIEKFLNNDQAFRDIYVKWIQKNRVYFVANRFLIQRKRLYNSIMSYIERTSFIPSIIYFNCFGKCKSNFRDTWIYGEPQKIFYLDEETCDLDENQLIRNAYEEGNYNFVAEYFAVSKISETGGFYIGDKIRYNLYINSLRLYDSVFSSIDTDHCSKDFFGSIAGASAITYIKETYSDGFYENDFLPLDERIKNVLFSVFDFKDFSRHTVISNICVTGIDETVYDFGNGKNIFTHDFSEYYGKEEYILIRKSILRNLTLAGNRIVGSSELHLKKS